VGLMLIGTLRKSKYRSTSFATLAFFGRRAPLLADGDKSHRPQSGREA
jgi:hypothetical protein